MLCQNKNSSSEQRQHLECFCLQIAKWNCKWKKFVWSFIINAMFLTCTCIISTDSQKLGLFHSFLLFSQNFIATEVLKLFSLKKEPNHKTDWQKMMKFGRKKRDRVDHILVSVYNWNMCILTIYYDKEAIKPSLATFLLLSFGTCFLWTWQMNI